MRSPDMAASDAPFPGISRSALHALETNSVALWEGDSRSLCEQVPGAERATCEREATVAAETLERAGGPTHMQIDTVAREGRDSVVANWTVRARGEVVTVTTTAILTEDDWQVVNVEFGAEDAR